MGVFIGGRDLIYSSNFYRISNSTIQRFFEKNIFQQKKAFGFAGGLKSYILIAATPYQMVLIHFYSGFSKILFFYHP